MFDQSYLADLLAGIKNLWVNGTLLPRRRVMRILSGATAVDNPNYVDPVTGAAVGSTDVTLASGGGLTPFLFATLRSTPASGNHSTQAVDGYVAQSDGAEGVFTWDPLSTATDDGGTIAQVTNPPTPTGRWKRLLGDFVSVGHFGIVGNGSDVTAAVVAADAVAAASGRRLYFPAGTYGFASNATLNSPLSFAAGAILQVSSGKTLTLTAAVTVPPKQQVFSSASSISMTNQIVLYPEWWGAVGNASTDDSAALNSCIAAAQLGARVLLRPVTYAVYSPVSIISKPGLVLEGSSLCADNPIIQSRLFAQIPALSGTAANITTVGVSATGNSDLLTVTGLAGIASIAVGDRITLSNTANASNSGTFTVVSVNSGTNTITCINNNYNLATQAPLATAPDGNNGTIHWAWAPPMVKCYSRSVTFRNITFQGANTVGCLINETAPAAGGICTNIIHEKCGFADAPYHVVIGDLGQNAAFPPNCETFVFDKCYGTMNFGTCLAGVYVASTTQQSKQHMFRGCSWSAGGGTLQRVIWCHSGSFSTYDCAWANATITAIQQDNPVDTLTLVGTQTETCARFLQTGGTNTAPYPINISGGRFDCSAASIAGDMQFIQFSYGGGLLIQGAEFSEGVSGLGTFSIGVYQAPLGITRCSIIDCVFPTSSTAIVTSIGNAQSAYWSIGNVAFDGTTKRAIPEGINYTNGVYSAAAIPSVLQAPALSLGDTSSPTASAGIIRIPNGASIEMHDGAAGADRIVFTSDAGNNMYFGYGSNGVIYVGQNSNTNVALFAGGTDILDASAGGVVLKAALSGSSAAGLPLTLGKSSFSANADTALSASQIGTPWLQLTGTLTAAHTITFPNAAGFWLVDLKQVTLGGFTLTLKSGTDTEVISTIAADGHVAVVLTDGANHIAVLQ